MATDIREQTIERKFFSTEKTQAFILTHCSTFMDEDQTESFLVTGDELPEHLEEYGCSEDLFSLLNTGIGKVMTIGFPQGSYVGLIITRIR